MTIDKICDFEARCLRSTLASWLESPFVQRRTQLISSTDGMVSVDEVALAGDLQVVVEGDQQLREGNDAGNPRPAIRSAVDRIWHRMANGDMSALDVRDADVGQRFAVIWDFVEHVQLILEGDQRDVIRALDDSALALNRQCAAFVPSMKRSAESEEDPATSKRGKHRGRRGSTINDVIRSMLYEDPIERAEWSASKWARTLNCSAGTVKESSVWRNDIMMSRARAKAQRLHDQLHR